MDCRSMTTETLRVEHNTTTTTSYIASLGTALYSALVSLAALPLEKWGVIVGICVAIFTAWINYREKQHAMRHRERELALHEKSASK